MLTKTIVPFVLQRVLRQNAGDCIQHRFTQLNLTFPALFSAADESANKWQHSFWRLIRAEYILLFLASVFTTGLSNHGLYHAAYWFSWPRWRFCSTARGGNRSRIGIGAGRWLNR